MWIPGSYDAELNLAFFGPAQTYDTGPLRNSIGAPGVTNESLYTDSTMALDPDTGKLAWHFQHQNNDQWDFDWAFERQLIKLPLFGQSRTVFVTVVRPWTANCRPGLVVGMPLTPVTQADSEFQRLLAKSPDSALHLFGDSCHRRLRLGVRLQIALICLGPGPPFHFAPGSFYSLFLPFGHLRISTVGLESCSLWHYGSYFVHC
jgi:hypothetical protein